MMECSENAQGDAEVKTGKNATNQPKYPQFFPS